MNHNLCLLANTLIGTLYLLMSLTLTIIYISRRKDLKSLLLIGLGISLTFLCGLSRITKGHGYNETTLVIDWIIVAIATITLFVLYLNINRLLSYRTPEQYQRVIDQLQLTEQERIHLLQDLRKINHDLANQVQTLQNTALVQGWVSDNQLKLEELKSIVGKLREKYVSIR